MPIVIHPPKYGVETAEHFVTEGGVQVWGISGYIDGVRVQTWTGELALTNARDWYNEWISSREKSKEFSAVTHGEDQDPVEVDWTKYRDSTNKTILEEARELVYGDRNAQYGHPKDDYAKVAAMWSAFLGVEISPHQAASMMIFIKMSRLAHEPKRDTIVDIAGYAEVVARILDMDE